MKLLVWLFATPWTVAYQAPLSMAFSRQEYWSGLPFPSLIHESEKWKWSRSVVSDSSRPHGLWPTRLLCPWHFPGNSTGVDCHFLLQGIFPNQGLNLGLLHCRQMLYRLSQQGTRSWCMIFLMSCWILVARILLRIFASMFISDICLQVSFFVASLSAFGIRVMVASENEFGSLPSSAIFCKSLRRINH